MSYIAKHSNLHNNSYFFSILLLFDEFILNYSALDPFTKVSVCAAETLDLFNKCNGALLGVGSHCSFI